VSTLAIQELFGLVLIPILVALVVAWIRIFKRIGWSGWLVIPMAIPFVNMILLIVMGFKEWPIEKRLKNAGGVPPQDD
jgi:hypothetical protein